MKQFKPGDIINAHALEQMRRFRAGAWKGGSGIAANHSGSRTRLVLKDKAKGGAAIWEPYGSKGGSYTNQPRYGADITSLMRRINALEYSTTAKGLGCAADATHVFVAMGTMNIVAKYTLSGTLVSTFGSSGSGDGQFNGPTDVSINGTKVFVCDSGNDRIQEFDKDGVYQSKFSTQASATPGDIYANATHVFVSYSTGSNRLEKYTHAGTLAASGGAAAILRGLQADATTLYVVSATNGVLSYDLNLNFISTLVVSGNLRNALTISGTHIYVADQSSDEIEKYTLAGASVSTFGADSFGMDFANGELYTITDCDFLTYDTSDTELDSYPVYGLNGQTEFFAYPTEVLGDAVSLGTPDGGVSIPALNGIDSSEVALNYITNMRDSIEALAPFFTNPATGAAFNWTDLSANNLYNVTFGGTDYDWTRDAAVMVVDNATYDVDINEIDACVSELESSATRCT